MLAERKVHIEASYFNNMDQFRQGLEAKNPALARVIEKWFAAHPSEISLDILNGEVLPSVGERILAAGKVDGLKECMSHDNNDQLDFLIQEACRKTPITRPHIGSFIEQVLPGLDRTKMGKHIRTLEEQRVLGVVEGFTYIKKISPRPGLVGVGLYQGYAGDLLR